MELSDIDKRKINSKAFAIPTDSNCYLINHSILKKGIGIEGEKLLKQVRGRKQVREWKQVEDGAKGSLYVE